MKLLADEDFNNHILRGLLRRFPELDVVRVQDVGLIGRHDREVLEWATNENRLVLTHDYSTMIRYAYERLENGEKLSGVVVLRQLLPIGEAIEELSIFIEYSLPEEWINQVVFMPLQN
jgi:predicted nuclease of predicted toxin-antitoxin system